MPNLDFPDDAAVSVAIFSPKLFACAECIATFPEPPVDAYVSPFGFRETDHAAPDRLACIYREVRGVVHRTWLGIFLGARKALKSAQNLPVLKVPELREALDAVVQRSSAVRGHRQGDLGERVWGRECRVWWMRLAADGCELLHRSISRGRDDGVVRGPCDTPDRVRVG